MCNRCEDGLRRPITFLNLYQHMFPWMTTLEKLMMSSGEEPKYVLRNELTDRERKQPSRRLISKLRNCIQSSTR
jgi:hypothetical protein